MFLWLNNQISISNISDTDIIIFLYVPDEPALTQLARIPKRRNEGTYYCNKFTLHKNKQNYIAIYVDCSYSTKFCQNTLISAGEKLHIHNVHINNAVCMPALVVKFNLSRDVI